MSKEFIYTSELEPFKSFHEWAQDLSPEEKAIYDDEHAIKSKQELYIRWITEQKILTVSELVDGVEVRNRTFN